ncbi:hypothetical protein KC328_g23 [Hortaea werneckii]|nr:hypothetical protein KC328_g23 [Hortaea werneckii]
MVQSARRVGLARRSLHCRFEERLAMLRLLRFQIKLMRAARPSPFKLPSRKSSRLPRFRPRLLALGPRVGWPELPTRCCHLTSSGSTIHNVPSLRMRTPKARCPNLGASSQRALLLKQKSEASQRQMSSGGDMNITGSTKRAHTEASADTLTQTVASDGLEDSDSFIVDLRGDAKNVEFGSLHRYSIPAYHRNGYGNLVGAPSGAKIDRDQSNDKCVTLSRRTGDRNDVGRLRLMAGFSLNERRLRLVAPTTSSLSGVDVSSDFISLYGDSELKQGPKASDSGDHVDYRSIDSKAKHTNHLEDEDLEFASDTGEDLQNQDTELRVRQENAALVRQTKERPNDVNAWRALIEHQARVICPGVDFSRLTASRKRTVAEIRLSIYDQALKHVTVDKPGYESLVCGMMAESSLVWDNHRLSRKWQDILRNTPTSMELWTLYLDHVQTTHNKFKYESWKATFVQCLETLQKARLSTQQPGSIQHIQIYVFLRCTAFIRDSGYDELAYGLWQAIFEQHSTLLGLAKTKLWVGPTTLAE